MQSDGCVYERKLIGQLQSLVERAVRYVAPGDFQHHVDSRFTRTSYCLDAICIEERHVKVAVGVYQHGERQKAFRFWILDFGFWIEEYLPNPKSKI
jgi:hypothetical protein